MKINRRVLEVIRWNFNFVESDHSRKFGYNERISRYVAWAFCAILFIGGLLVFLNVPETQLNPPQTTPTYPLEPKGASSWNFAKIAGNSPSYYIPVTLVNNQSSATVANLTVNITINSSAYSAYFAANLANVNWQDGNGNILPSWLESGATNTNTSTIYWVNLGSNIIPANGGLTIYEVIYATSVVAMDGVLTGAYPTFTDTYGQYDDGANVFLSYFNGISDSTSFTIQAGFTFTQETNVAMPIGYNGNVIHITGYAYSGANSVPIVFNTPYAMQACTVEASAILNGQLPSCQGIAGVVTSNLLATANGIGVTQGYSNSYFSMEYMSSGVITGDLNQTGTDASEWVYGWVVFGGTASLYWTGAIAPQLYTGAGGASAICPYQPITSGASLYLCNMGWSILSTYPYDLYINWERARASPPNDVMPTTTVGPLYKATVNFLPVGGNLPVSYRAITLNNTQNVSTPANFQQMITTNPSNNAYSYASNLANVNWQDGNGTILNSWLESGASSSSTSTVYWVNLGSNFIAPHGTLTIYEVIYAPSVNAMNAINTGAYPTYTGTYGQYDTGANVFSGYDNFSGSVLSGFWNASLSSGSYTISNGLTIPSSASDSWVASKLKYNPTTYVLDVNWSYAYPASGSNRLDFGFNSNGSTPGINALYWSANSSGVQAWTSNATAGAGKSAVSNRLTSLTGLAGWQVFSLWSNGYSANASYYNASLAYQSTSGNTTRVDVTEGRLYIENNVGGATGKNVNVQWVRLRLLMPNDVKPTASPGALTNTTQSVSIASQYSKIDQGQNSTLSSVVSGGFAPYEYQWFVQAPASSYVPLTGANTPSYAFTSTASNNTGAWLFKLQVTDSNGTSVNSTPSAVSLSSSLVAPSVSNVTIDLGQVATLANSSAITTGTAPYSYQWLSSTSLAGPYEVISGATSVTYSFTPASTGTTFYTLNVTDSSGIPVTVTTSALNVTVNPVLQVGTPAIDYNTIDEGQSALLSVSGLTGGTAPYYYQWLQFVSDSYVPISGANAATYATPTSLSVNTYSFEVNVTDATGASLVSTPTTLVVNIALSAPTISSNPNPIDLGQSMILANSSVINTGTAPYSYQWLNCTSLAGTYTAISGATDTAYTFTPWTTGTWYFKLNVTDSAGVPVTVTSNVFSITVNTMLLVPTVSVNNNTIDLGQLAVLTNSSSITTGTAPYTYQWLNSTSLTGTYTAITGATSSVYIFTPWATGTWYFKLNMTDSAGVNVTVTSGALTVNVNSALVAPSVTVNHGTINVDETAVLSTSSSISTGTAPYSYQWLNSTSLAGSYVVIPGATGTTYAFTSWATGTWYFVLNVTDSAGVPVTVTSSVITVTVTLSQGGAVTVQPSSTLTSIQRINATFSFTLTDPNTSLPYPQSETSISVSFGTTITFDLSALTWSNGSDDGVFNATFDTRVIPAGTYALSVTFSRMNYADVIQVITLIIEPFQPRVSVPESTSVTENTDAVIEISVADALLNQQFDAISISWNLAGTSLSGQITQVSPSGDYSITLSTSALAVSADYKLQITIQVTIDGAVYSAAPIQSIIVRVEYATILGIPSPTFWLLVGIIGAVVGASALYTVTQKRKTPRNFTQRKIIPLKLIIAHINNIPDPQQEKGITDSNVDSKVEKAEVEKQIDEVGLNKQLIETQQLAKKLFAEGTYLEAQKKYKIAHEILLKLGRKEEAQIYSELARRIKEASEKLSKISDDLERRKSENRYEGMLELYLDLIENSKQLNDEQGVKLYQSELIQLVRDNKIQVKDLESIRNITWEQAASHENDRHFEQAAELYKKCERISQILLQLGYDVEHANLRTFLEKRRTCLKNARPESI